MRCEVIAVGTELLLGQIVDTNSSWIGEQLASAGIDSHFQTKVGDNATRIAESLRQSLDRSDAVIMCGGLGPTHDDITRDVIANVMGVELVRREDLVIKIRAMFEARGRDMPENNLRQADVPEGADTIAQQPGTAPGLICPIGDKIVYAVPGVPSEMREMVLGTVLADLRARSGEVATIGSRVLRTWGRGESGLAELLADRISELDNGGKATIAFLASGAEGLKVRITAKAKNQAALDAVLDAEEQVLRALLGDLVFGTDDDTMESVTLDLLAARGLTLAVIEVATGGYLTTRLSGHAVASDVLRGGLVGVDEALIDELAGGSRVDPEGADAAQDAFGPAEAARVRRGADAEQVVPRVVEAARDRLGGDPEQVVLRLAEAARDRLGADVGIAVGQALPRAEGGVTVAVAWTFADEAKAWSVTLPGDLDRIRQYTGITLLDALRNRLGSATSHQRSVVE